jgi:2-oxoisovalerate dehydrogenase E2 component (dihydrolipoyl transacylase)
MATVTMPQLGESVTEGTILKWLKQPGEPVQLDDPLCEIETEKVTAELPSPYEGTMGAIVAQEGETVAVGAPLCEVHEGSVPERTDRQAAAGWSGGPMAIPPDEPAEAAPVAPAVAAARTPTVPSSPDTRGRFYSPAVVRLAGEHGVDLEHVTGTGIGGRVTRKDVEQFIGTRPAPAPKGPAAPAAAKGPAATGAFETVTLSATRKTIAEHLTRSNLEAPQAWTMVEADVTALVRLREREKEAFAEREGVDLTLLPYFAAAVCECLREFPMLNARWEGGELRRYRAVNLGVAVAAEQGLVVPVIRGAGDLSVAGLARAITDLVARARARKLRVEDVGGGTFTVNNTGAFGSIASKPIVNHPEVGIVTMERVVRRPVVLGGDAIAIRAMLNVCLSFDHRALDGLEAGGFLAALRRRLEAFDA